MELIQYASRSKCRPQMHSKVEGSIFLGIKGHLHGLQSSASQALAQHKLALDRKVADDRY